MQCVRCIASVAHNAVAILQYAAYVWQVVDRCTLLYIRQVMRRDITSTTERWLSGNISNAFSRCRHPCMLNVCLEVCRGVGRPAVRWVTTPHALIVRRAVLLLHVVLPAQRGNCSFCEQCCLYLYAPFRLQQVGLIDART